MKTGVIIGIIVAVILMGIGVFFLMNKQPAEIILPAPIQEGNATIIINDYSFNPGVVNIKVGSTVRWINKDPTLRHTVTSDSKTEILSDILTRDQSYEHTFNQAGNYSYHCLFHESMKGLIVVV